MYSTNNDLKAVRAERADLGRRRNRRRGHRRRLRAHDYERVEVQPEVAHI
jgi:hypothetical protein